MTITSPKPPPLRDESRWNGFHLWRTESQNLRASEDRAAAQSSQLETRQNWIASIGQRARGWYAGGGAATEIISEQQRSDDRMTWVHMFLLTVVSAGGQVSVTAPFVTVLY